MSDDAHDTFVAEIKAVGDMAIETFAAYPRWMAFAQLPSGSWFVVGKPDGAWFSTLDDFIEETREAFAREREQWRADA
jgi:hypothetical protein